MKIRGISKLLCPFVALCMLAGCGMEAPQTMSRRAEEEVSVTDTESSVTLIMAEVNPLDSIAGMTDVFFKEKVEELSAGSIQIDLRAGGVLGSEDVVLNKMVSREGTIDLARISAFALTDYGGTKSALLSIPYTFENREHFWKFAESDLAQELLLEPQEHGTGLRGLFYGEEGFRHFFSATEVKDVEDFAGMRIRISNDPIMENLVMRLNAKAEIIPFDELYAALQKGVVDGAEQPIANYQSNAFSEVAPYLILDGHTLGAIQIVITDDAWNRLTREQQAVLKEAGEHASDYNRRISEEKESQILKDLVNEGCTITEIHDITPWRKACETMADAFSSYHKDVYQEILNLK